MSKIEYLFLFFINNMADLVIADRQVVADIFLPLVREHIARNKDRCEPLRYFEDDLDLTKYRNCMVKIKPMKHKMGVWSTYAYSRFDPTEAEKELIPHFPTDKVQHVMEAKQKYDAKIYEFQTRFHMYPPNLTPEMKTYHHYYHMLAIGYWMPYKK